MTAVAYPLSPRVGSVRTRPGTRVGRSAGAARRSRPNAAQFRRRRAAAAAIAAVLLGGVVALGMPGEVPLTTSGPAPTAGLVPVARTTYVVRPGDTLWEIATALVPSGDVRPLVQRLVEERQGAPLRAGERLVLPVR